MAKIRYFLSALFLASPLFAQQEEGGAQMQDMLILVGGMFVIFYFLLIRPQKKKQDEHKKMVENLKKGQKVLTMGGIHGVIEAVRDNSVVLKVDEKTKLEILKSAVQSLRNGPAS